MNKHSSISNITIDHGSQMIMICTTMNLMSSLLIEAISHLFENYVTRQLYYDGDDDVDYIVVVVDDGGSAHSYDSPHTPPFYSYGNNPHSIAPAAAIPSLLKRHLLPTASTCHTAQVWPVKVDAAIDALLQLRVDVVHGFAATRIGYEPGTARAKIKE